MQESFTLPWEEKTININEIKNELAKFVLFSSDA